MPTFTLSEFLTPAIVIAAAITLVPYLAAAFFSDRVTAVVRRLPLAVALTAPALLCLPYLLVSLQMHTFHWGWLAVYALAPQATAVLLWQAGRSDTTKRGNWRDYVVLLLLGLAVDLRWLAAAWPVGLAEWNKLILLDAAIYGMILRELDGVGFDLRLRWRDFGIGLREFAVYAPIAIALGLMLGFLHPHVASDWYARLPLAWIFIFFAVAVPEELYFRGWLQNLLERRIGRAAALAVTAVIFGLSHFNKGNAGFNLRYVLLATLAGIYYGRAWRAERRMAASAITHATVDAVWSVWLK